MEWLNYYALIFLKIGLDLGSTLELRQARSKNTKDSGTLFLARPSSSRDGSEPRLELEALAFFRLEVNSSKLELDQT